MKFVESPNYDTRADGCRARMIIIHYTGTKTAEEADEIYRTAHKVAPHYMVDRDGALTHYVAEEKRAWHAGQSSWGAWTDINSVSIGIECVNHGHDFGDTPEAFPDIQIKSLVNLIHSIRQRHAIPNRYILGHSDIAVGRKIDPGEAFPWRDLARHGVGLWPQLVTAPDDFDMHHALTEYGYTYQASFEQKLAEFQRHYVVQDFLSETTRGKVTDLSKNALYSLLRQISEQ